MRYLRGVMLAVALVLPTLSLVALGGLWLWQQGVVLLWAVAAFSVTAIIYLLERWIMREPGKAAARFDDQKPGDETLAEPTGEDPSWSPRDLRAWNKVQQIANQVKPEKLESQDAIMKLGISVVDAVAREMHPEDKHPLWRFTVPEALALVEKVSAELNRFVTESIPLGDRLTVGQLRKIYQWRSLVDVAERAYDVWRVLRLVNPATAIAGELREKITGQFVDGMRAEFTRRLARAYVREVGRAAIDLYGNRLQTLQPDTTTPAITDEAAEPTPLALLLAGQPGAGKSALVNALTGEVQAAATVIPVEQNGTAIHRLSHDDKPIGELLELDVDPAKISNYAEQTLLHDAILWVTSATRPDRAVDAEALAAMRQSYAAHLERRPPPVIVVLTHIDRLRPFNEWSPPYDLTDEENAKSRSIRQATEVVARDLSVDVEDIIPVCVGESLSPYNVDVLWSRILAILPQAANTRLTRQWSSAGKKSLSWKQSWTQAVNAGRVLGRVVRG